MGKPKIFQTLDDHTSQLADNTTKINDRTPIYQNLIWVVNNPSKVAINDVFQTLGFYVKDDGGEGKYKVIATTGSETWTQVASAFYLDGSGNVKLDTNKKLKLVTNDIVNIAQLGAIGTSFDATFNIDTSVDDTVAIQNAIVVAKAIKGTLVFKAYTTYKTSDTLVVDIAIDLDGNGAILYGNIKDKTKPIFLVSNQREREWKDIEIRGNAWLPLAGMQFTTPDNQAMRIKNIKALTCRYGFLIKHSECFNRVILDNCRGDQNLLAGFYMDSLNDDGVTYGISSPFFFKDCIFNGNGIIDAYHSGQVYGIPIKNADDIYGYQVFIRSAGNVSFMGGQISNHNGGKNLALAMFYCVSGVYSYGMDVEDLHTPVMLDGTAITDLNATYNDSEASAVLFKGCQNVSWLATYTWKIQTQSVFKFQNLDDTQDTTYLVKGIWTDMNNSNSTSKYDVYFADTVGKLAKLDTDQTRLNVKASKAMSTKVKYRKINMYGTDFNNYIYEGQFFIDGATLPNSPNNSSTRWLLDVTIDNDGTVWQRVTSRYNPDYTFFRTYNTTTWVEWKQTLCLRPNMDINATFGNMTILNNAYLKGRNQANTETISTIGINTSDNITVGASGNGLGFYGGTGVAKQILAAAATDATTTQTLVNDIRAKLIALGLMS